MLVQWFINRYIFNSIKETNWLINEGLCVLLLAIYKIRNTGMGNGMRGTRGMFTRIPGNLLEDSGECSHFSIAGNAQEDSRECSRRFRGMLLKIPRNAREDSGECY